MAELELVRVERDGTALVLRGPDGTEHALPVTDALRAAIARAPRATAASAATPLAASAASATSATSATEPTLRPRDLQARLRAGATAEELAAEAGIPVENVRRYEWPVLTEREHVIGMVRAHDVPGLDGTRELGKIADSRLAARGVHPEDATWTARREGMAPWVVEVRFSSGDRDRSARWTFDLRGRVVTPLDDEARWLGQPDDPLTPEVRGVPSLAARRGMSADSPGSPRGSAADRVAWGDDETDLLLDDLAGRRGHRPASRVRRPATSSLPVVSPLTPPAAGSDDGAFQVIPLGDLPVRERRPVHATEPDPVALSPNHPAVSASRSVSKTGASEADTSGPGASVVDLGRWNPRRPRDRAVSPGGGPGGTQPALLTPSGKPTAGVAPSSTSQDVGDDDAEAGTAAKAATTAGSAPRPGTPARGVPSARRKGRAAVPSWDEIVFGARPEPS